ncbi:MAG: ectoine synthase [Candidatus Limnocylindria bacterium]
MIIRSADDVTGTQHEVSGEHWTSRRILTAADAMGFSLNDVLLEPGFEMEMEYRHHLEACYVVSGSMDITDLASGREHVVAPGGLYALDQHDHHVARSPGGARLVCIFNPALAGTERHVDGGYEPLED